ncbi:MAG: hypothetical protein ACREV7_16625 [Steroidobacteraceae bacterium]
MPSFNAPPATSQFHDVSQSSLDAWRAQHAAPTATNAQPTGTSTPGRSWAQERIAADVKADADYAAIIARRAAADAEAQRAADARRAQVAIDAQAAVIRRALSGEPLLTAPAPTRADSFRARFAQARTREECEAIFSDMLR